MSLKNPNEVKDKVKESLPEYLESQGITLKNNKYFSCFNPSHADGNPSAMITNDKKGYVCMGCDSKGDVLNAYSIIEGKDITGKQFYEALKELATRFNIPFETKDYKKEKFVKDDEYVYQSSNRQEVYKMERFHQEKDGIILRNSKGKIKKSFYASHKREGGWFKGLGNIERVIYKLPEIEESIQNQQVIYLVEGEKCADILRKQFGLCATTIPFGSQSWIQPYIKSYVKQLKGAKVVLLPDNDNQGYELMEKIKKDISVAAESVKQIKLSEDIELEKGGDIEDWIKLGGTKERLIQLTKQTKAENTERKEELHRENQVKEQIKNWYTIDVKGNTKVNSGLLARHIINNYPSIFCGKKLYFYKEGVYKEYSDEEGQGLVKNHIDDVYLRMSTINDVMNLWKIDDKIRTHPSAINLDNQLINVKNGLYNVEENILYPHNPNVLSTIQYDVNYNPETKGETFKKFLNEVAPDKEQQKLLQEIAGYTMSTYNVAKKFFVIVGPRDSGKSTFLNLIVDIVSEDYLSHINMQDLSAQFNKAELFGKVANIANELPEKGLMENAFIKTLVGRDPINAAKKYKDPFSYVNMAKLIFACNSLPTNYGDRSEAFYKKMLILEFDQQIPEHKMDVNLPEKLKDEKEYIFLWAMEGLRKLSKNGFRFSETSSSKGTMEKYRIQSNSVLSFVNQKCTVKQDYEIKSVSLYDAYKDYCQENNFKPFGRNKFKEEIETEFAGKIVFKLITQSRLSGYSGVRLKDNQVLRRVV